MQTAKQQNQTSIVPAEWAEHKAIWTAFPSHAYLWQDDLEPAQVEVAGMIQALAEGDLVKVLVMGDDAEQRARELLIPNSNIEIIQSKFGDIWLRDTGPIFTADGQALRFKNNGWGGKYDLEHDDTVGDDVAAQSGKMTSRFDFILEGGAVDQDGQGTLLTTAQCVLNANRNTGWTKEIASTKLCEAFGASKVIWIDEGLINDHTDGHIDNIARFIGPGKVACQSPFGEDDANADILNRIAETLRDSTDAAGRKLEVVQIPSPGRINNEDGEPVPASHMNFIIGNKTVVVPLYGAESGEEAVRILQEHFPNHKVIGMPSNAILSGGGSFHCITQQEPS